MIKCLIGLSLSLTPCVPAMASDSPSWVQEAVRSEATWTPSDKSHTLLSSERLDFEAGGQVRVTIRNVSRLSHDDTSGHYATGYMYLPYGESVKGATAWILDANGKSTDSFRAPDFTNTVMTYDGYTWDGRRYLHFSHPDRVENDGYLAWEVVVEEKTLLGEVRGSPLVSGIPCLKASLDIVPAPGAAIDWWTSSKALLAPTPGKSAGSLHWEIDNQETTTIPLPTGFIQNSQTVFARSIRPGTSDAKVSWQAISQFVTQVDASAAGTSPEIEVLAQSLIKGKQNRWDRIRALTEFVQQEVVYLEFTLARDELAGIRPHTPAEVLKCRYGDCKDKAGLLVAMLSSIGEKSFPVLVIAGDPSLVRLENPSFAFNHAIVAISADDHVPSNWPKVKIKQAGDFVIFDPTDSATPLGALPETDQDGAALLVAGASGDAFVLPASQSDDSHLEREVRVSLRRDLSGHAAVTEMMTGNVAVSEFKAYRRGTKANFQALVEARESANSPLAAVTALTSAWDPATVSFHLNFNVDIADYAKALSDGQIMFSPKVASRTPTLEPWRTSKEGVAYLSGMSISETTTFTLPEGATVSELPDDWSKDTQNCSASISYKSENGTIIYHETIQRKPGLFAESDYDVLRKIFSTLRANSRRPVLIHSPTT